MEKMKKRFLIIYLTNNKMKTPREKAIEYCMEVEGQIHQPYIDAFIAGYNSANELDKTKNICEHIYISNLDPDEEDYDLICKKCGHRTN